MDTAGPEEYLELEGDSGGCGVAGVCLIHGNLEVMLVMDSFCYWFWKGRVCDRLGALATP